MRVGAKWRKYTQQEDMTALIFVTSLDKLLNFSVSQFLYLTRQEVAIAFR